MKFKKFFLFNIQRIFLVIQRHFFEFQTLFVELLSLKFEIPRK